ncbi:MAG: riboflavin biosynthesis protein RibF [Chloroflexota bacterium]
MEIFTDVRQANLAGPTYLTIGNLDGMHRGHLSLIEHLVLLLQSEQNQSSNAQIGLITFDPHPRTILRPELPLKILSTPEERMAEAAKAGATLGVIQPFTSEIAHLRAVEFMALLKNHLGLKHLVVGPDFALGKGRSGNVDRLAEIGRELGYELTVLSQLEWNGRPVRSSQIRQLLADGDAVSARDLLSRPYAVTGRVIQGDRRGRTIGIPTANLAVENERLLPMDGVYATRASILTPPEGRQSHFPPTHLFDSVTNLGFRPTVEGREHRFETHLLDFSHPNDPDSLYGAILRVEFIDRLRGEKRFNGLDELVRQINTDIEKARTILRQPAISK